MSGRRADGRYRVGLDEITVDAADRGPVAGGTTAVLGAGEPAAWRNYLGTVTDASGVASEWTDEPAWTGQFEHRPRASASRLPSD